jgi:4-hydroxy-3-methylbut-2-en-1-yl diphosphate reductase
MQTVFVKPSGYCHGVVSALSIVSRAANDDSVLKPIYILGEIVHNNNITRAYAALGVITLQGSSRREILQQVDHGTVIVTAHGIDPKLIDEAVSRGLNVIDATCSDVVKTHDLIRDKVDLGYDVIYIGKKGHPEPEGAVSIAPDKTHLVENIHDIDELVIDNEKICLTNQTTMSL